MAKTLQELTVGKRIILVGNSVEILQHEKGDLIDSYDTVVRFGRGAPVPEFYKAIGSRTDIWVTGFLRASSFRSFPEDVFILFNRGRVHMNLPPHTKIPVQVKRKAYPMFSDKEIIEINKILGTVDGVPCGDRPSAGLIAILFFLRKCNYKSLTLIGFDFFQKTLPFMTGEDKPSSWHMPVNTQKKNIHSPKEKDIVLEMRDKGLLEWIILSDLNKEDLKFT